MGGLPYLLNNGPQEDRATYITNTTTGFEPATGAVVSTTPCILMSAYISISSALGGAIFVQFYDQQGAVAVANAPAYALCSESLATPSGTFIWQPGDVEEVEYIDPVTRTPASAPRFGKHCNPDVTNRQIISVPGFPFDKGLIIIASTVKNGFAAAAADLIRVTARVRYPGGYGGGL